MEKNMLSRIKTYLIVFLPIVLANMIFAMASLGEEGVMDYYFKAYDVFFEDTTYVRDNGWYAYAGRNDDNDYSDKRHRGLGRWWMSGKSGLTLDSVRVTLYINKRGSGFDSSLDTLEFRGFRIDAGGLNQKLSDADTMWHKIKTWPVYIVATFNHNDSTQNFHRRATFNASHSLTQFLQSAMTASQDVFLGLVLKDESTNNKYLEDMSIVLKLYTSTGDLVLQNITIDIGQSHTYEATGSITAAGDQTYFTVEGNGSDGGSATFDAGTYVTLLPGFSAEQGSYFHAYTNGGLGKRIAGRQGQPGSNPISHAPVQEPAQQAIPTVYSLSNNYPNPFNPSTMVRFGLPEPTNVWLIVYDILGREVARLVDGNLEAAYHTVMWQGRNASGMDVPSGVYIARLITPKYTKSIKMLLLK
jgi:hypothetical protein